MARTDIVIYGAGIFGLSVAFSCLKRGACVRVVDPGGVAAGSSGGLVGALSPHTPETWNSKKAFQFESLLMAQSYWDEVENLSGRSSGYGRVGRLQPVVDQRGLDLARDRAVQAANLWRGAAIWEVLRAEELGDWAPRSPSGWVIRDTLSARLHPRQAGAALAAAVQRLGGQILTERPTAQASIEVWATGYQGLLALSAEFGRPVGNGVKGQAMLLRQDRRRAPQLFGDALHIVPHADGTVAIGSTSEREFDDPASTDAQLEALYERALLVCPALAEAPVLARWAGVRPRAKSRAPMLGPHPARPGVFIVNGGFKIGFGMAPKIGEVMADLILDGQDRIPDAFRIEASL